MSSKATESLINLSPFFLLAGQRFSAKSSSKAPQSYPRIRIFSYSATMPRARRRSSQSCKASRIQRRAPVSSTHTSMWGTSIGTIWRDSAYGFSTAIPAILICWSLHSTNTTLLTHSSSFRCRWHRPGTGRINLSIGCECWKSIFALWSCRPRSCRNRSKCYWANGRAIVRLAMNLIRARQWSERIGSRRWRMILTCCHCPRIVSARI